MYSKKGFNALNEEIIELQAFSHFSLFVFGNGQSHVQLNQYVVCVYILQWNADCSNSYIYMHGEYSDNEFPFRKKPAIFFSR